MNYTMIIQERLGILLADLNTIPAKVGRALTTGLTERFHDFDNQNLSVIFLGCTCLPLVLLVTNQMKLSRTRKKIEDEIYSSRSKLATLRKETETLGETLNETSSRYQKLHSELESKKLILAKLKSSMEVVAANKQLAPEIRTKIQKVIRTIQTSLQVDSEWNNFRCYFEKVDDQFLSRLKRDFPTLSPNEIKLCSLYRMNNDYEQVAAILEISVESARVMKHRLRKKLGVSNNMELKDFLNDIDRNHKHEVV